MGCASSSLAHDQRSRKKGTERDRASPPRRQSSPPKRQSSPKKSPSPPRKTSSKERSLQRLLSYNTGAVFRLGPDEQKGVETRLRRLSAPLIPAGTTYQQGESSPKKEASSKKQQQQPGEKAEEQPAKAVTEPEQPEAAAESVTKKAAIAAVASPTAEQPQAPTAGPDTAAAADGAAAEAQAQQEGAAAAAAVAAAAVAPDKPVLANGTLGSSRARRSTVVGAPAVEVPADEETSSTAETTEGTGDSPLNLSPMFRTVYSEGRSRSQMWRQLEDFNLMEHVIHSVASLSRAGREPGYRKTNQDNCFAFQQYLHPSQALFGTMDGHGPNGHKVSSFIKKQFPIILAKHQDAEDDNAKSLVKAFVAMQQALAESSVDCEFSGSTAVVALMHGRQLTTAWVGDSRAVLARQEHRGLRGIPLTRDHKPASHIEKMRIQAAGGRVERLLDSSGKPIGPHRVWLAHSWVPGLAMSRALGDAVAHSVGVTAVPDTDVTNLTPQDRFLILASDGVWEFINSQTAVELVAGCTSAEQACRILVDAAHDRWIEEEEQTVDDISVVVVKFK